MATKTTNGGTPPARSKFESAIGDPVEEAAIDGALLREYVGYAVRRAQLRIYGDFFATLAGEDITPARFTALLLIRDNPRIRQTDLAKTLGIARSGAVKLIVSFEEMGLVERQAIGGDRRSQALVLTAEGRKRLKRIDRSVAQHEARICAHLSVKEKAQLLDLLSRLAPLSPSGRE